MVGDWWQHRQRGNDALMLARRNTDVDDLNRRARRLVARNGEALFKTRGRAPARLRKSMNVKPFTVSDLCTSFSGEPIPVIGVIPGQIVTRYLREPVRSVPDFDRDILKIVVVERQESLRQEDPQRERFALLPFEPEVHDGDDKAEVAGCAFGSTPGESGVNMDGNGTVTLTLSPSVWFDEVDFSYVAPGGDAGAPTPDANGVVDIAGTLAWEGFIRGVKKGTGYEFSYAK